MSIVLNPNIAGAGSASGDITAVVAGSGLTGGGTSGSVTLALSSPASSAAGANGAVQLSDGSGVFVADATNLLWDRTNHKLGIGNATPLTGLHVSTATSTTPYGITVENNVTAQAGSRINALKSRGTPSSKTAISSGDTIFNLQMQGHDGTSYATGAMILGSASEAYTGSQSGGELRFHTTKNGVHNNATLAAKITNDAALQIYDGSGGQALSQYYTAGGSSYQVKWPASQGAASTNLQNDGSGNLSWSSGGSGATTALDNLSSVQINSDLVFGTTVSGLLKTNDETAAVSTDMTVASGATVGDFSSGALNITSGSVTAGNVSTGAINIKSGDGGAQHTGIVTVSSGVGVNASGNTIITTGTTSNNSPTGTVFVHSGDTTGNTATGETHITSGAANGGGNTGAVIVKSGDSAASNSGDTVISIGAAAGTRGKIILDDGSAATGYIWTATDTAGRGHWAAPALTGFSFDFGDGSDGAIDLDGVNTYAYIFKSGNDYYLRRQIYATNLTVRAGIRLFPSAYSMFGTGTLTIEATGVIEASAAQGAGALAPTAGGTGGPQGVPGTGGDAGYYRPNGYLADGDVGIGSFGGSGGIGNLAGAETGASGNSIGTLLEMTGGDAGFGGNGSAGSGAIAVVQSRQGVIHYRKVTNTMMVTAQTVASGITVVIGGQGGDGGSGGAGDGVNSGGGGGGGGGSGGVIAAFFDNVVNDGEMNSNGANGAVGESPATVVPVTGGVGGGGGGGGGTGGLVYIISRIGTTGVTNLNGGTGGAGGIGQGISATNGDVGGNGSLGLVLHFRTDTGTWI